MSRDKDVVKQKVMKILAETLDPVEFSMVKSVTIDLSSADKDALALKEKVYKAEYAAELIKQKEAKIAYEDSCMQKLENHLGMINIRRTGMSISIARFYYEKGFLSEKQEAAIRAGTY